jgi:hypothetical protein
VYGCYSDGGGNNNNNNDDDDDDDMFTLLNLQSTRH